MKKVIISLLLLVNITAFSQLPYSWTSGVNPGWTQYNWGGTGNILTWQSGCSAVTTNCSGNYVSNEDTEYMSSTINGSGCTNITVSFNLIGKADLNKDYLYFWYSQNGGSTWSGYHYTGTWSTVQTFSYTIASSSSLVFSFEFTSNNTSNDVGYKITNFGVICADPLPIELLEFTGFSFGYYNKLKWITASETNNDNFTIERSKNSILFDDIGIIKGAGNSSHMIVYTFEDKKPYDGISYYRLKQTDYDGNTTQSVIISVYRMNSSLIKLIRITNIIGQEVNEDYVGMKIYFFNDGSIKK